MGGKIYIDCQSNLTHQGSKIYSGNYANSLQHNFALAIPAKVGVQMKITGLNYLNANP